MAASYREALFDHPLTEPCVLVSQHTALRYILFNVRSEYLYDIFYRRLGYFAFWLACFQPIQVSVLLTLYFV